MKGNSFLFHNSSEYEYECVFMKVYLDFSILGVHIYIFALCLWTYMHTSTYKLQ